MDELQRDCLRVYEKLGKREMSRKAAFKLLRAEGVADPKYFLEGISIIISMRETLGECEHSPARLRASEALDGLSLRFFDECLGHKTFMSTFRFMEMQARIDELKKG